MWLAEGSVPAPSSFSMSAVWTTRERVWLLMEGGLVLVVLFPWRGIWLSPRGCTRIGVWCVAIGWSRARVGLARAGLGLVVIPGGIVWLSTFCRARICVRLLSVAWERVWFAAFRGAGKGVRWMTFCRAWVWILLAKGGAIAGLVVDFLDLVFVADLGPRRWVRMAWAADLTVARMKRPRLGIRMVAFTMRREERVRWALLVHVGGKVRGGEVLVERSDGHASS